MGEGEDEFTSPQIMEEYEWVEADMAPAEESFLHRHLLAQGKRALIVLIILACLAGLHAAGKPGAWILARMAAAAQAEFPGVQSSGFSWLNRLAEKMQRWFSQEWQVSSPSLGKEPETQAPVLSWPVKNGKELKNETTGKPESSLDIQAAVGAPVLAAAAGVVISVKTETDGSQTVLMEHEGSWRTVYGRCQAVMVQAGARVSTGQTLGLLGTAPPPAPSHLHFELWGPRGQADPRLYLMPNAVAHDTI